MSNPRNARAASLLACAGLLTVLCSLSPSAGAPRRPQPGAAAEFTVEDVGFNFDPNSVVVQPAINSAGQVAGPSIRPPAAPLPGPRPGVFVPPHDAHRTNAALTIRQDLFISSFGTSPPTSTLGFFNNNAYGINLNSILELAQVTGEAFDSDNERRAFRFTDTASPKMEDLGTLGGDWSAGYAINNSGQVVGESEVGLNMAPPLGPFGGFSPVHAFRYTDGVGMEDLGALDDQGFSSVAYAVNEAGHVAGLSEVALGGAHAFLYTDGAGMQDLGTLPSGGFSAAHGMNDLSPVHVVGESEVVEGESSTNLAVRWRGGTIIRLGALIGDLASSAADVNNSGTVVGTSFGGPREGPVISGGVALTSRAFIWRDKNGNNESDPGELQDLNTLIPSGGWSLLTATAINDAGQIVGVACLKGSPRCTASLRRGPPISRPRSATPRLPQPRGRRPEAASRCPSRRWMTRGSRASRRK